MANTLFDAISEVRPVNWGLLIHLYRHYNYITADEEDLLTIAAEDVTYKVHPTVADSNTSSNPIIPDAPPSSPGSPPPQRAPPSPQSFWTPVSPQLLLSTLLRKSGPAGSPRGGTWTPLPRIFKKIPSSSSRRTRGAPDPVLSARAHHQRGQPGAGQLRTREHPPGDSEEGGLEETRPGEEGARPGQDGKCAPTRTGGHHVERTRSQ